jgi:hypothetical protein
MSHSKTLRRRARTEATPGWLIAAGERSGPSQAAELVNQIVSGVWVTGVQRAGQRSC